jgi:hypothetical protein
LSHWPETFFNKKLGNMQELKRKYIARASKFGLSFAYAVFHDLQNYAYRYFGYCGLLHLSIQRT